MVFSTSINNILFAISCTLPQFVEYANEIRNRFDQEKLENYSKKLPCQSDIKYVYGIYVYCKMKNDLWH